MTHRAATFSPVRLVLPALLLLPTPSMPAKDARVGFSLIVRENCKEGASSCVVTLTDTLTVSRHMSHALGYMRMPQVFEKSSFNKIIGKFTDLISIL